MTKVLIRTEPTLPKEAAPPSEQFFDRVRQRAYELFEYRGEVDGHDLEDWLQAEKEIMEWPPTQLEETDRGYRYQFLMPGFDPQNVEVTVAPGVLRVLGRKETRQEENATEAGKKGHWTEFTHLGLLREVPLPEGVVLAEAGAFLDKGVLEVLIPKPAAKPMAVQKKAVA